MRQLKYTNLSRKVINKQFRWYHKKKQKQKKNKKKKNEKQERKSDCHVLVLVRG